MSEKVENGVRIMRRPEAQAFTGCKRTTFNLAVKNGLLPGPIKIGARTVGWVVEELQSWHEFVLADRDGTTKFKNWREFHDAKHRGAA